MSATADDIKRWDEWFATVGMTKQWAVVKEQFTDSLDKQVAWATIIELNRLNDACAVKERREERAAIEFMNLIEQIKLAADPECYNHQKSNPAVIDNTGEECTDAQRPAVHHQPTVERG